MRENMQANQFVAPTNESIITIQINLNNLVFWLYNMLMIP